MKSSPSYPITVIVVIMLLSTYTIGSNKRSKMKHNLGLRWKLARRIFLHRDFAGFFLNWHMMNQSKSQSSNISNKESQILHLN